MATFNFAGLTLNDLLAEGADSNDDDNSSADGELLEGAKDFIAAPAEPWVETNMFGVITS